MRWWDGRQWTPHTQHRQPPSARGASNPQPDRVERNTSEQERQKVPLLGARKRAEELQAALDELGGLDYIQVRQATERAQQTLSDLAQRIKAAQHELMTLEAQLVIVRNAVNLQEVGLYDYEHPAESSATLAADLAAVKQEIKYAIQGKQATTASSNFLFNGSPVQGRKFVDHMSKTMLTAYNAEAENCIKAVRAGNLDAATARLNRMVDQVARNGAMIDLRITPTYHRLRVKELGLAARHLEAVKREKEEERERRAEQREQEKAERELQAERDRLEKEKQHNLNAIQAMLKRGDTEAAAELEAKVADIEKAINDVDYRAANIRAGYIYVISNVGAFGPDVVKIGMTRRLDPMDRVRELGDASVPFRFDVHALFFADDAVGIETALHHAFAAHRLNRINSRREFFRVTPQQVLDALKAHNVHIIEYRVEPEAEEFRLSGGNALTGEQAP